MRLIDLALNRKLTISKGGYCLRSLIVAPIPESVWFQHFFDKLSVTLRCDSEGQTMFTDVHSAGIDLVQEVAIGAEGYPHLVGAADWASKIPLSDKITYGGALIEVSEIRESHDASLPTLDRTRAVRIEAAWGSMDRGEMCFHRHLAHHFEVPSKQHRERYRDASTKLRRVAGVTRRGPAVFLAPEQPLAAHALAALYDELILRVDGYAVNGELLSDDRAKIIAHMDTFHKVRAAGWLFSRVRSGAEWRRVA